MQTWRSLIATSLIAISSAIGISWRSFSHEDSPFPAISISLSSPVTQLSDFVGIALGFRRLAADIAWIQTLIYYGTHEEGVEEEEAENGGGHYPLFLAYSRRVAEIDPEFKYVFYYSAGVLGWNLNRLDEATAFLEEGIRMHPKEWKFQQYLAALAFQKNHDINHLTSFLQEFSKEPDCPNLLRSILANIYKKQHRYREAISIWTQVYQTGDATYLDRALSQIKILYPLARQEIGRKAH